MLPLCVIEKGMVTTGGRRRKKKRTI